MGDYILAKFVGDGRIRFVRRILRGGLEIDSAFFSDLDTFDAHKFGRTFRTIEKAQAAADKMEAIGGPHGYAPMHVAAQLSETGWDLYQTGIDSGRR